MIVFIQARIGNNANLNDDEKKMVLIANEKITCELTLKLKGGTTSNNIDVRNQQDRDGTSNGNKESKWRLESKILRDAIKALRSKRKKTFNYGRKSDKKGVKRARFDPPVEIVYVVK